MLTTGSDSRRPPRIGRGALCLLPILALVFSGCAPRPPVETVPPPALVWGPPAPPEPPKPELPRLTPGATLERRLPAEPREQPPKVPADTTTTRDESAGGVGSDLFAIVTAEPSYLVLTVDQPAVDVALRLLAPDGAEIARADDPEGRLRPERITRILPAAGEYRVEVLATGVAPLSGVYRITLRELQAVQPGDAERVAAEGEMAEAHRLARREEEADLRQALEHGTRALELWHTAGDPAGRTRALLEMAALHLRLDEIRPARELAAEAQGIARERSDRAGQAWALDLLGECDGALDPARAATEHDQALALWRESGDADGIGRSLYALGLLAPGDESGRALPVLEEASTLLHRAGDADGEARALAAQQVALFERGEVTLGRSRLAAALALARSTGHRGAEAVALFNAGRIASQEGRLEEALAHFQKVAEIDQRLGAVGNLTRSLLAACTLEIDLGDYTAARACHDRLLALSRRLEDPELEARSLSASGWLLHLARRDREALDLYARAAKVLDTLPEERRRPLAARNLRFSGATLRELRRLPEALADLLRARELLGDRGPLLLQAQLARDVALCYQRIGNLPLATETFARAAELAAQSGSPVQEEETLYRWALLETQQGQYESALERMRQVLAKLAGLRSRIDAGDRRSSYFAGRRLYFELDATLLMRLHFQHPDSGFDRQAFEGSEAARARGLFERLSRRLDVDGHLPADLLGRERDAQAAVGQLIEAAGAGPPPALVAAGTAEDPATSLTTDPKANPARSSLAARLDAAEAIYGRIQEDIRARDPRLAAIRDPRPATLAETQAALDGDTALLHYLIGEERSFLFVVTRDRLATFDVPIRARELAAKIQRLRAVLARPDAAPQRFQAEAVPLYEILLRPAKEAFAGKHHLLIAPDGPLWGLPFEVLLTDPRGSRGKPYADFPYLLRDHAVSYVPAAASLLRGGPTSSAEPPGVAKEAPRLVVFADPLAASPGAAGAGGASLPASLFRPLTPQAREEIETLVERSSLGEASGTSAARLYLGPDASERRARSDPQMAAARRLLFATGTLFDPERPERSGLALTAGQPRGGEAGAKTEGEPGGQASDDGLLTAGEIFHLSLHADLVLLMGTGSAGAGGEGVADLARAFHQAGARDLVIGLWPLASPMAPTPLPQLLAHLDAGQTTLEALRAAKLDLLQSKNPNPAFWAPLVLIEGPP